MVVRWPFCCAVPQVAMVNHGWPCMLGQSNKLSMARARMAARIYIEQSKHTASQTTTSNQPTLAKDTNKMYTRQATALLNVRVGWITLLIVYGLVENGCPLRPFRTSGVTSTARVAMPGTAGHGCTCFTLARLLQRGERVSS